MDKLKLVKCEPRDDLSEALKEGNDLAKNHCESNGFHYDSPTFFKDESSGTWEVFNSNKKSIKVIEREFKVPTPQIKKNLLMPSDKSFDIYTSSFDLEDDIDLETSRSDYTDDSPAGWLKNGKPAIISDLKKDAHNIIDYENLTDNEQWALAVAVVNKCAKYNEYIPSRYHDDFIVEKDEALLELKKRTHKGYDILYYELDGLNEMLHQYRRE